MRLSFRPDARLDIHQARDWYEAQSPGLGAEFVRAVDAMVAGVLRFPAAFPKIHGAVRMAVLRRFPYALLYVISADDEITVLACLHHRRDPTDWQERG